MITLGVDVSKATLALAVWTEEQACSLGSVPNTPAGWEQARVLLEQRVGAASASQAHLVLEPTGGYELAVAVWAHEQGWQVSLPNPRQVRAWAISQGRRAKTDRQDARLLAQYGAKQSPPLWHPLTSEVSELEGLLRRRTDVEGLLQQERNRREHLAPRPGLHDAVPRSVERLIGVLEEELAQIEQAIADHLRQHPPLQQARTRLLSVPGVGPRNVLPLLVLLCRWQGLTAGHGDSKGLVAYAGLDPQPFESGTSVHHRAAISRQGERSLRRSLYMGALGGVRGNNPLRTFYQRLVGRGKAKKLALVAAARKILVWSWAIFQAGTSFEAAKCGA